MAGIAFLAPTSEVYECAQALFRDLPGHMLSLTLTNSETILASARHEIENGATILISRGLPAYILRNQLNLPVIELATTVQELGLHILKAKKLTSKPCPYIGIFLSEDMFCDLTHFNELFGACVVPFPTGDMTDIHARIDAAISDGMDVLIGGHKSAVYAWERNFPAVEFSATEAGIREAVEKAENLYRMLELERLHHTQFSIALDSASNGLARTNRDGIVTQANPALYSLLGISSDELIGYLASDVISALPAQTLAQVLTGAEESVSLATKVNGETLIFNIEAITLDHDVSGAIISCNPMRRIADPTQTIAHKRYMQGYTAQYTLEQLAQNCPDLNPVINKAKLYAQSLHPLWIEYRSGSEEARNFCQGIHNYSSQKDGPYIEVDLVGMDEAAQMRCLFGIIDGNHIETKDSALVKATLGTLTLLNADLMTPHVQALLIDILHRHNTGPEEVLQIVQVRLLLCTQKTLAELRNNDSIADDVYYSFCTLRLTLPALNSRRADLQKQIDNYLKKYNTYYARYHVLTDEARQVILDYPWHGGAFQLDSFFDRMILGVNRRIISSEYVSALLSELYPDQGLPVKSETIPLEEQNIRKMLHLYNGNRGLTAKALGISTSTLWRKIKHFGIEEPF